MPTPIRAAVIGCGGRGKLYARLSSALDELQIVGFVDARQEAAAAACAEFGGDWSSTDVDRAMDDPDLDAVIIATWHDTHTPYAVAAAEAGKAIFIEKPLALSVAECETIAAAVEQAGVPLVTGFKLHHCPLIREVTAWLGEPWLITGQMMDNTWGTTHWAVDPIKGGGNVLSQGCHTADLLRALAGAEPVRVFGEGGTFSGDHPELIDTAVATIAFANGAVATLVQGDLGENKELSKFFFQAWGRSGRWVHLDRRLHRAVLQEKGQLPRELTAQELCNPIEGVDERWLVEGDFDVLKAFVDAVQGRGPAEPGVFAATQATRLITSIFESIRSGQPVEL